MDEHSPLEKLLLSNPPVPPIKPDTPHYEAVGRLVTWFANAETSVHVLARKLSGMPDAKARIIFGGMRLADLTDLVRQMARIDGLPDADYAEIDACLTQLNFIASKRHSLVHRGSNFFDGSIVVSNIQNSKSMSAFQMEIFKIEHLVNMQIDLSRIMLRVRYLADPADFTEPEMAPLIISMRQQPWQYKHAPPKLPNPKTRDKSSKQSRQPSSSRRREAMERAKKPS